MTARLLDGTALSRTLRVDIAAEAARLVARGVVPGLAVVLVGDDPASHLYVRNKVRACADAGIASAMETLPGTTSEAALLAVIARLNADPAVHGILVQMPLPPQIDPARVTEAIALAKDVDGFHLLSAGALATGRIDDGIGFRPCTPYGVMRLLEHGGVPIAGAQAVVVGRSPTVGKPMAAMLLDADATVTICHSRTRDLAAVTRSADIVVAAVGRPSMITAAMIKPGAAVVDVGMNRDAAGKLVGDVDADGVRQIAGWLSPVPGGVGPMTITMLLANTITAAERTLAAPPKDPTR